MIEFVVDIDSCAQLAAYLNREPLTAGPIPNASSITMNERLDNMMLMTLAGYNPDEIFLLVDKLEHMPLCRLAELYPPASRGTHFDDEYEDEPDPVSDETIDEVLTVVMNNDERIEVLEEELGRYHKELVDVRSEVQSLQQFIASVTMAPTDLGATLWRS